MENIAGSSKAAFDRAGSRRAGSSGMGRGEITVVNVFMATGTGGSAGKFLTPDITAIGLVINALRKDSDAKHYRAKHIQQSFIHILQMIFKYTDPFPFLQLNNFIQQVSGKS
jgi:hypothetical protein